ncbi:hypothetical protein [Streptomyces sp. IBSNAI001]|uniref:hypothetical protein n=1 Tax=Streptomyces sp. IBSNAI001 TaxID=3457499 RepID=UPI003FD13D20
MTERHTVDSITSDALDQLYDERDQYRADCQKWSDCVATAEKIRQSQARDADQYEAQLRTRVTELETELVAARSAIDRVRAELAFRDWPHAEVRADRIRDALDQPQQPTT